MTVPILPSRRLWRRLKRHPQIFIGGAIAVVFVLLAVTPSFFVEYAPLASEVRQRLQGPSAEHPFGTDRIGRDVLSRVVHGSRISLTVGFVSTLIAGIVGGSLGVVAAYYRGATDLILSRIMDILFSFPALILAITLAAALGAGARNAIIAIAVVYTPLFFRIVRAPVLALVQTEFVEAGRALGVRDARMMALHVVPNALSPFLVEVPLTLSRAILTESYLSFLGLGVQPPTPSWGSSLAEGITMLERAPWLSIYPGIAIVLAVIAFNLIGDALRDLTDPNAR